MTQAHRRIVLAIPCLIGLAVVLLLFRDFRGKRALRDYKEGLTARGEKLTIEAATPRPSIEAQRAASDLLQAAWQLRDGAVVPTQLPGAMRYVSPGRAMIGWEQPEICDGKRTNSWQELAQDLKTNAAALEEIREALAHPQFDMNLNYSMGANLLLPHLSKLKGLAQWLLAATVNDLHSGRLNAAATNLNALISLANAFHDERTLISQLVRMAVAAIAVGPTWEALQTDQCSDAQLAGFQRGWAALEFWEPVEQALEMERATSIELFDRLRNSSAEWKQLVGGNLFGRAAGAPSLGEAQDLARFAWDWSRQALNSFTRETAWRWLWSYDDELRYVQTMQIMIELPRRARRDTSFSAAQAWGNEEHRRLWQPEDAGSAQYFLSAMLTPALDRAFAKAARAETQRELVVAAVALKRYQLRHKKTAPNLNALVPEFLPRLPVDPMDGKPLRYLAHAPDRFTLYSVNDDGKDDQGDPRPASDNSQSRNFADGRDLVWPVPATEAEAAEARAKETKKFIRR